MPPTAASDMTFGSVTLIASMFSRTAQKCTYIKFQPNRMIEYLLKLIQ